MALGRRPTARRALVALVAVAAVASCSDEPERPAATVRTDVSSKPGPDCHQIALRQRLAKAPPQLPYAVRNNDVANFTGESSIDCDERQIVYWGAPSPIQGDDRPMVYVRLLFLRGTPGPEQTLDTAGQADQRIKLGPTPVAIFDREGQAAARFVVGPMIVNVVAACVKRRDPEDLRPTACVRPAPTAAALRRRLIQASRLLERQLRALLR